ncbi:MAG: PIN domain-containing protein [Candidatus Hodarchaeales archaeon]|jgi:predicted nucleic acid-binding protein
MKRFFLDSSFFFPFIKVGIEKCNQEDLLRFFSREDIRLLRSEITLFELSAKGSKLVNEGKIEITDFINGINTVNFMSKVVMVPIFYSEILSLATKFRKNHPDFIDCVILASAVYYSDIFVTLDESLRNKFQESWRVGLDNHVQDFKVLLWKDVIKK